MVVQRRDGPRWLREHDDDDQSVSLFASKKGKVFPYSLPSVGPGADPGVQAVSPQVTSVAFTRWRYL